ncbi:uncharacterized protein ARMOST_20153 [Armillaria ostoyae]|uniref:Uncharacterized protein n=1 Tax=Armillaria ostoyae TaxID=47428 RepID=A0A284S6I6_ARMOS|nr:uncharacterized protein ARMOST_20153 [Armillaria ostoyae]
MSSTFVTVFRTVVHTASIPEGWSQILEIHDDPLDPRRTAGLHVLQPCRPTGISQPLPQSTIQAHFSFEYPWFVLNMNVSTRTDYVGIEEDEPRNIGSQALKKQYL